MNKGFYLVMAAQALSSVADNALLIAAIAIIADLNGPSWMSPMLKWWFALAYVVLGAFVGAFADSFPKGKVMFVTNAIKLMGCMLMFCHQYFGLDPAQQLLLICASYTLVGVGAAAYSPAKYGIVTEMLKPEELVKGNSWIEGLTVLSIIIGTFLGGILVRPEIAEKLAQLPVIAPLAQSRGEVAILLIVFIYLLAALCNLRIPPTNVHYPAQQKNPIKLLKEFKHYVHILWQDKIGQISLAVTTLFWGAGATLQFIVIEWSASQLGYKLSDATNLMGMTALGTVVGAILAGRVPLRKSLSVLPMGILMGLIVLLMPVVHAKWEVYTLLLGIGALSGFFVVPMNAILQHRGHVLLSAGHSIAVQNFNEQLNILLFLAIYSLLLWLALPINIIIIIFGVLVASLMTVFIMWKNANLKADPGLLAQIGQQGHGQALQQARAGKQAN